MKKKWLTATLAALIVLASSLPFIPAFAPIFAQSPSSTPTTKPSIIKLTPEEKERNKKVDQSIQKALAFLASKQKPSGAWVIDTEGESTAGTSLAIMAFMSAGHVPGEGEYGKAIEKGVQWVIKQQKSNGLLIIKNRHGHMYSHGISTLMLAEVVGMMDKKNSKEARKALEKGIRVILKSQKMPKSKRNAGGWRYTMTSRDSDLSATGWQLLALRAAKDIGCDVPAEAIDKAVKYVKLCSVSKNRGFSYQPGGGSSPTRSGTGILCLEVCGKHHSKEAIGAADYLLIHPINTDENFFYYGAYYCGVGMFKMGGKYWKETKAHLSKVLMTSQKTDGSWFGKRQEERRQGRVYCTSLAVLALAVEYRYLPIYQR